MLNSGDKEVKISSSNPGQELSELLWDIQARNQNTKAFQEAIFISASSCSVDSHPEPEPREQRGFALYTYASRLQKQEAGFNLYMVVCISIGYFTLNVM
jgi:hypothetical protein